MQMFTANEAKTRFGEFLDRAQRESVGVLRHDSMEGMMVSAQGFKAMQAFYANRVHAGRSCRGGRPGRPDPRCWTTCWAMSAEATRQATRVVLDTNMWISAALSAHGAPTQLVQCVASAGSTVSPLATFASLETRLWKRKFDRYLSMQARRALLHDVKAMAHRVTMPAAIAAQPRSRDSAADPFVRAALAAAAPWLVTGDPDLLVLRAAPAARGVAGLAPADALAAVGFCR